MDVEKCICEALDSFPKKLIKSFLTMGCKENQDVQKCICHAYKQQNKGIRAYAR